VSGEDLTISKINSIEDLEYLSADTYNTLKSEAEEISKMLNGLANSLADTGKGRP
jgi:four helix bundle protein